MTLTLNLVKLKSKHVPAKINQHVKYESSVIISYQDNKQKTFTTFLQK